MSGSDSLWAGPYVPHSQLDLVPGIGEGDAVDRRNFFVSSSVPSSEGDAFSLSPVQLQALLCLDEPPEAIQMVIPPEPPSTESEEAIFVYRLNMEEHKVIESRAVFNHGHWVPIDGEPQVCQRISAVLQGAYPPRSLSHAQTCPSACCRRLPDNQMQCVTTTDTATLEQRQPQITTDSVLGTPELLELIVSHLDIRSQITSALRVCRFWYHTINNSNLLQKASFFRAKHPHEHTPTREPQINPLLVEAFGEIFLQYDIDYRTQRPFRRAEFFWMLPFSPTAIRHLQAEKGSVKKVEPTCLQQSFTRKGASWRRMLITQPTMPFIGFTWLDSIEGGHRLGIDTVKTPEDNTAGGVTMGQLYDTIQSLVMKQSAPGLFFRVRWDMICKRADGEQTHLVVQFWDDLYFNSSFYGPFSMEATRNCFKCEEAVEPRFVGRAKLQGYGDEPEVPSNSECRLWQPFEWS